MSTLEQRILLHVTMVQYEVLKIEAAAFRAIAAMIDDEPPGKVALPSTPSPKTTPTPAPLPEEPVVVTDDGPSPDEAAAADLAPVAAQAPVQPPAQPPAQPEAPKASRGRPRKKAADVPPVDIEDIPAAAAIPPIEPPKAADPAIDDIPWGGPDSAPVPTPKAVPGPIASGFGDDDSIPADDAADPSSLF